MLLEGAEFANLGIRYIVGENTSIEEYAVVQEVSVGVEIRWSSLLAGPYLSSLTIEMDGEPVAAISSPPQEGRAVLTDFNFDHPLLQQIPDEDSVLAEEEAETPDETQTLTSPLRTEIWDLSRDMARQTAASEGHEYRVGVKTEIGALPDLNRPLESDLRDPEVQKLELEQSTPRVRGLAALLDELVLGPVRIARDYLNTMTYIGPLREIPSRGFRPQLSPDESRWAHGLAAWDLLYTDVKGDLTEAVNDWLNSDDKLRTDYRVERAIIREIEVPSRMNALFERGLTEDDLGELQARYEDLNTRVDVALRDFQKGILVAPSDVGVGISQMIPVVVGCLTDNVDLLVVEQPELHIHPAVQVGMGDLFICTTGTDKSGFQSGKSLLVETHSEHIMLRLLRRIRETSDDELPPGAPSLTPDLLSVIYVETTHDDGVVFRPLRVDNEGEFIDRWPRGFFEERAEELF